MFADTFLRQQLGWKFEDWRILLWHKVHASISLHCFRRITPCIATEKQVHCIMSEISSTQNKQPPPVGIVFTNDGSFMAQWHALQAAQAAAAKVLHTDDSSLDPAPGVSSSSASPPQPEHGLTFKLAAPSSTCNVSPGEQEHQHQTESLPREPPVATTRKRPASAAAPVSLKTNKSIVKGLNPGAVKPSKQAKAGEVKCLSLHVTFAVR